MSQKFHRFFWVFMVCLFVLTGLGIGVYAFWQNTHGSKGDNYIKCSTTTAKNNQQPGKDGKLAGAQLVDFTPTGSSKLAYLKCVDYKVGTGAVATATSSVTVNYVGALAQTGKIFQSSFDNGGQPATLSLNGGVIPGWAAGVPGMKVGGLRRLIIPSSYGYGPYPPQGSGIPANADLVFDISLLSVSSSTSSGAPSVTPK